MNPVCLEPLLAGVENDGGSDGGSDGDSVVAGVFSEVLRRVGAVPKHPPQRVVGDMSNVSDVETNGNVSNDGADYGESDYDESDAADDSSGGNYYPLGMWVGPAPVQLPTAAG